MSSAPFFINVEPLEIEHTIQRKLPPIKYPILFFLPFVSFQANLDDFSISVNKVISILILLSSSNLEKMMI